MTKKIQTKKPWTIFIALALAIFVGSVINKETVLWGINLYKVFDLLGKLFINSLTLVVVPLVASSIIMGVAKIASEEQFGRLGLKTFGFFILLNFIAICIGVSIANLLQPGVGFEGQLSTLSTPHQLQQANTGVLSKLILNIIPPNILAAFAKGNMLGLIFFSLLFGYAITRVAPNAKHTHFKFWEGIFEGTLKIVHGIMKFLPFGVFCLASKIFAEAGLSTLKPLGKFIGTTLLGLSIFAFIVIPLLLKWIGRVSVINYFRSLSPALVTAFSTGSSSATLPIAMECIEERAGISNRICSLVLPLGISVNLSGTALYCGLAGLFIAQVYGIHLSLVEQLTYILAALFISFGVACIPGGGLVAILTLLKVIGLPTEGIGLIVALDHILNMFRTSTNLFSYTTSAVLVAKTEGERGILAKIPSNL